MVLEINIYWVLAYSVLSIIIIAGMIYSFIISFKDIRSALGFLISATVIINIGIIVHTFAILEFGSDNAQITEFLVGHILLTIGFVLLIFSGSKILEVSKTIGFGGK